jgi:hypothetical protein
MMQISNAEGENVKTQNQPNKAKEKFESTMMGTPRCVLSGKVSAAENLDNISDTCPIIEDELSPIVPCHRKSVNKGLVNFKNTCFINATIQVSYLLLLFNVL